MNIFYLDRDPRIAAQMMCDKHVVKMILESAQMLSTAKNITHDNFSDPPQCMPNYCTNDDTVLSYQNYYIVEKSDFATWKRRAIPEWFNAERGLLGLHE